MHFSFARKNQQNLFNICGSMCFTIIFLGINNCTTLLPLIEAERNVMYRERFAGMYSSWAYSIAQVWFSTCKVNLCSLVWPFDLWKQNWWSLRSWLGFSCLAIIFFLYSWDTDIVGDRGNPLSVHWNCIICDNLISNDRILWVSL